MKGRLKCGLPGGCGPGDAVGGLTRSGALM